MKKFATILIALLSYGYIEAQSLYQNFVTPPQESRPRVWWHWMNGNITKDGIYKDLTWMKRAGIGGFQVFDAGMATPQVVSERLIYMTPKWKDAFGYAINLGDSMKMEAAITSAPGWSCTGGPWVSPADAMKKLTWREMVIKGGTNIDIQLPAPYRTTGFFQNVPPADNATTFIVGGTTDEWYDDIAVIAVRLNKVEKTLAQLGAKVTCSGGDVTLEKLTDGDLAMPCNLLKNNKGDKAWIQYELKNATTMRALSVVDGNIRSEWADAVAPVTKHLLCSNDGKAWKEVCEIPHGGAARQTITIPETKAKYFRVTFENPVDQNPYAALSGEKTEAPNSIPVTELVLYPVVKINHAEEKAGFATPHDTYTFETPRGENKYFASSKDIIDLTKYMDKQGHLQWSAPKGDWRIYRFGYSLTGKKNHPASPEATGLEVDKLDKDAVSRYINHHLDSYQEASKGLMGKRGVQYLLIDSYEAGWETWTPRMAEEFERRRGYSIYPWMPVLTGQIIDSAERSEQFLFDWRKTIGELIAENMYGQIEKEVSKRGLKTYYEAHENGRLYLVDGMEAKSKGDIPMAAAWCPTESSSGSTVMMAESDIRESASVAHVYGKRVSAGESLTANGLLNTAYKFYPGNLKPVADMMMANGQNLFVIHESSHQPVDSLKPGIGMMIFGQWFHRHETWAERAKAWTDYLSRSSYMLQQGRFVSDVAYYYGEDNNVTSLFGLQHPDIPFTYNYDYINAEALTTLLQFDGKTYTTPNGMQYRLLALDKNTKKMSLKVLRKIVGFVRQGGFILGDKPTEEPTLLSDKLEFTRLVHEVWETERMNVLSNMTVGDALKHIGIAEDFNGGEDSLRYVHRTTGDSEIYWVSNQRNNARNLKATFRVSGLKPMLWHPETGQMEDVSYQINDNNTIVDLSLVAHDAVFVVFSGKADKASVQLPKKVEILFRHVDNPWTVNFDEKWGGPCKTTFDKLISYTESANDSIKYYSGKAVYHNHILVSEPELKQGHFVMKLGNVGCMATVKINGHEFGTLWKAPYNIDVTEALKPGQNDIEIEVINLWPNRLIGDQQPNCKHKYTYTSFGGFYQADSKLIPSGLMGPVDIFVVRDDPRPYSSIRPGELWVDTNGKPIQAHGFQIMEKDGTYYWYGENKEFTTRGSHVWTWGIRCYKSTDLYNWTDCGLIIKPDTVNSLSPLHYTQSLDRPHIIYNKATNKYVCWIKSMDEDGYFVIMQANDFLGPYTYVRSIKPEGFGVGDFDLYADPETGKGYVWFERPHWELICATMTDDYTNVTPEYSTHFVGLRPPFTREAPTHFIFDGKHYLFTSGTTGYYANESKVALLTNYHGKYIDLGNPHPTDMYNHSFCSQITDVVKIPGKNLYVAVADRWMPQLANTMEPAAEAKRMIKKYRNHQPFPQDFSEPKSKDKRNEVRTTWDVTYNGTYVFLPIVFKNGKPQIEWKEEWRIEDYE